MKIIFSLLNPYPLGRRCGKREPQPERLGKLLPLSKLKPGDEQGWFDTYKAEKEVDAWAGITDTPAESEEWQW
jgi:hypothetical protein